MWQAEDGPRYVKGCISSIVSWVLLISTYTVYFMVLKRENARRDRLEVAGSDEPAMPPEKQTHVGVSVDSDMTDKQDVKFRYTL